ncbi:hypothetical protein Cs7R123_08770 [Catellatospora sp. TT07R-123]|uniref:peptidase inhibitor family I36 protein n=1 Tax=Catellatospora sp. TT07R-123 TaxID=2733863 RepID=UPI001B21FBB5|nr:peptidase inhibitor family I36 protein [Catellatospora sp. TT07R-123]GHJ43535.1 hypothetical protein Cs7R123_08770 [Catellatospora sp. TT07R-123]
MRILPAAFATLALACALAVPATAAQAADAGPSSLAATLVTGADAAALAGPSCPSGNFCVWRYTNPGSDVNRYNWSGSDGDYRNNYWGDGATVDNTPSAVKNSSNQGNYVEVYAGYNYGNTSAHPYPICGAPGDATWDLRDLGFDNAASSHRFVSYNCFG